MSTQHGDTDPWARATWSGAEEETLRAGAQLSLPERLDWLERSARLARALQPDFRDSEPLEVAEPTSNPDGWVAPPLAPGFLSLLELLSRLGGAELLERWSDATLAAGLVGLSSGRRLLVIERTYREGIKLLLDPTEAELAAGRENRLWELWNADRAELLARAI